MTDNRTTELREKLNKLIIELDRLDITLDSPASDMTLGEYEQEREKLLDGFMQAIATTLGSEREAELQSALNKAAGNWAKSDALVREMWHEMVSCPDYAVPPCMTSDICERVRNLEIEVN